MDKRLLVAVLCTLAFLPGRKHLATATAKSGTAPALAADG
jgi:hypothetical protein